MPQAIPNPRPVPIRNVKHTTSMNPSSLKSPSRKTNAELVLYAYLHLNCSLLLLPPPSLALTSALAILQRQRHSVVHTTRGGIDTGDASPPPPRGHERRSASTAGDLWGLTSSPVSAFLSTGHLAHMPSHGLSKFAPHAQSCRSKIGKLRDGRYRTGSRRGRDWPMRSPGRQGVGLRVANVGL